MNEEQASHRMLSALRLSAALLAAFALPAAAQDSGQMDILDRHVATLANLGRQNGQGGWIVGDDQFLALKRDLARLLDVKDPNAVELAIHPQTRAGLAGGHILGQVQGQRRFFVVGKGDAVRFTPGERLELAGTFTDVGGTERLLIATYDSGDSGYRVILGMRDCTGSFDVKRDGGSIDASMTGPEGEGLSITRHRGDNRSVRVNGGSFVPITR